MNRWERKKQQKKHWRAVAYMRHSAQGRQENSIDIQRDKIHAWAEKFDVEIVAEFTDSGKTGTNTNRPGFNAMMEYVKHSNKGREKNLDLVVCYDVSRFGRFQNTDMFGYYEILCAKKGVDVVYAKDDYLKNIEENDEEYDSGDDLMRDLGRPMERHLAKKHSQILSVKVLAGTKKVSQQGFRAGGPAPYGTRRLELDNQQIPIGIMEPKQYKRNPNNRVRLTPDEPGNAQVVRLMFTLFVEENQTEKQIAEALNKQEIHAPMGGQWRAESIRHILQDEQYAGAVIYYKTRHKLGNKKTYVNPPQQWIRVPGSYEPVVEPTIYEAAQEVFRKRNKRISREEILEKICPVFKEYGMLSYALLNALPNMPSKREIVRECGSLPEAFHLLYSSVVTKVQNDVRTMIEVEANDVREYEDFLIINHLFTIKIVPVLPFPRGYGFEWHFRIDKRTDVDITLGVPLRDCQGSQILGYFPWLGILTDHPLECIADSSTFKIGLYGHLDLRFIFDLIHWTNTFNKETAREQK